MLDISWTKLIIWKHSNMKFCFKLSEVPLLIKYPSIWHSSSSDQSSAPVSTFKFSPPTPFPDLNSWSESWKISHKRQPLHLNSIVELLIAGLMMLVQLLGRFVHFSPYSARQGGVLVCNQFLLWIIFSCQAIFRWQTAQYLGIETVFCTRCINGFWKGLQRCWKRTKFKDTKVQR